MAPTPRAAALQDDGELSHSKKVVVVYVTQYGFEPSETGAHAGNQVLMIRNSSGIDGLQIVGTGLTLTSTSTPEKASDVIPTGPVTIPSTGFGSVSSFVTLTPGVVTLTEPSHPEWRCQITVAP